MRIQPATDYFGNKIVSPVAQPVAPFDNSISTALENLSNTFLGIAQNEQKKGMIAADKADRAQLETIFTEHQSGLEDAYKKIKESNADLPADQQFELMRAAGNPVLKSTSAKLRPDQQIYLEPLHAEALLRAKKAFNNYEEAKLEQARTRNKNSAVEKAVAIYEGNLKLFADSVMQDKTVPDNEKFTEILTGANQLIDNLKKTLGPDLVNDAEVLHEKAMYSVVTSLRKQETVKLDDEARANFMTITESLLQRAATNGSAEAIRYYDSFDNSMFSKEESTKNRIKFVEDATLAEYARKHQEASNNLPALNSLVAELSKKGNSGAYTNMPEMDPISRQARIVAIKNEVETEQRRIRAEAKAAAAERKQDAQFKLTMLSDAVNSGMPVDAETWVDTAKSVKGNPMLERKYNQIKEIGTSDIYHQQLINTDPMKYGAAVFGYKLEDLNISDPAKLIQQIEQRKALGAKIQAANGLKFMPVLKQDEVKMLKGMLDSNIAAGTAMLTNIRKMIGPDAMMGIASQMKNLKDVASNENADIVAYVAQNKPDIAASIAAGRKYLKDKAVLLPDDQTKMRPEFDKLMGTGLQGLPETQVAYYNSWRALYAYNAAQKGIMSKGEIDDQVAEDAFRLIVGTVASHNGKKVLLPEGYDESTFKNVIKGLTIKDIQTAGGAAGLTDTEALQYIRDGKWYATKIPGVYQVEVDGHPLARGDGQGFVQIKMPDPISIPKRSIFRRGMDMLENIPYPGPDIPPGGF